MSVELKPLEQRVLGVLIEKSMAHPQYYPMTINAIVVGCNQKNNRDPVMELTEGDVSAALHGLGQWQIVSQAPPDHGARVNRFLHEVEKRFNWNSPIRAIMAELMLRGPQTVGELRTNAGRLTHLDASEHVREILGELQRLDPPLVVELPRQTGQSATRFAHLLGGAVEAATVARAAIAASEPAPKAGGLEQRVAALEAQVQRLREDLAAIRARLGQS